MGKVNISTHISTQVKQQLNNDQQVNQLKMQPKVKQQLNMHQQVNPCIATNKPTTDFYVDKPTSRCQKCSNATLFNCKSNHV